MTKKSWVLWLVALAACTAGDLPSAPTTTLCNETAAAIASRALECNSDTIGANSTDSLFLANYSCNADTFGDAALSCARAVARAPCSAYPANPTTLEPLLKRDAPICNAWVQNTSSAPAMTPYGSAQLTGTFTGAAASFSCTFAPTALTEVGAPQNVSQAVAAVDCDGTVQFTLVISQLQANVLYTSVTAGNTFLSTFVFPDSQVTDDGTDTLYNLQFTSARLDPDNYLVATANFHVVRQGASIQYDLQGSFDLVIQPPAT